MIDNYELDRTLLRFQFQPELFLEGGENRREVIGIRRKVRVLRGHPFPGCPLPLRSDAYSSEKS